MKKYKMVCNEEFVDVAELEILNKTMKSVSISCITSLINAWLKDMQSDIILEVKDDCMTVRPNTNHIDRVVILHNVEKNTLTILLKRLQTYPSIIPN